MRFDAVVAGVGERFLSERTFDLVLAPALADYQIERDDHSRIRAARVAVMIALTGALRMEAAGHASGFLALALIPFSYYIVLLAFFCTFFDMTGGVRFIAAMIPVVSLGPVLLCFWPTGRLARPVD